MDEKLLAMFNETIRDLYKIDSKMKVGQFIDAWRENRRVIARLEKVRADLMEKKDEE